MNIEQGIWIHTLLKGVSNFEVTRSVIARSVATWQSHCLDLRLLRSARNDAVRHFRHFTF